MVMLLLAGCILITKEELAERLDRDQDGVPWPEDCDDADASAPCEDTAPAPDPEQEGPGDFGHAVALLEGGTLAVGAPSEATVRVGGNELDGPGSCTGGGDGAGWSLAAVPDLDDDGEGDLLVGAPELGAGGSCTGRAWLAPSRRLGGASLDELVRLDVAAPGAGFGWALAAPDLDGDGLPEAVVGAPVTGSVYVFAGTALVGGDTPPAASTWEAAGAGFAVAAAGDVDGDGAEEALVVHDAGLSVLGGPGPVEIASVAGVGGCGPGCAAGLGDVDGDGRDDVAVADSSNVYVLSGEGLDGEVDAIGGASLLLWGDAVVAVAGAGDVAGDTGRDLVVSEASGVWLVCALGEGGVAIAEATCGELSADAAGFGAAVAGGVDLGLGGAGADLAVGAPEAGVVRLFPGER